MVALAKECGHPKEDGKRKEVFSLFVFSLQLLEHTSLLIIPCLEPYSRCAKSQYLD